MAMMRTAVFLSVCLTLGAGSGPAASREELEAKVEELEQLAAKMRTWREDFSKDLAKKEDGKVRRLSATYQADSSPDLWTPGVELDFMWLVVCGALVMFMQPGFAMLECGTIRAKSAVTVLLKNLIDATLGTLCWFLLGYGLAYGGDCEGVEPNKFCGACRFAGNGILPDSMFDSDGANPSYVTGGAPNIHGRDWFFQWAFCATAATIVSGAVAERMRFPIYCGFSALMTAWIYPIVVWWTWSGNGWLTNFWGADSGKSGYSDFAGSGIVHLTGGSAALVGAILCGPRAGRFENPDDFAPHNVGYTVLGTFILWFGWYGFNCGSTLGFNGPSAGSAAHVAVNTTMAAACGGLTVFTLRLRTKVYDVGALCNGVLAGLVAVCAGVGDMYPATCILVGVLGGCAYELAHTVLILVKVDDPIDAFAVHGAAGITGVLLRPLLDYRGKVDVDMFIANLVGVIVIMLWSGGLTALFLLPFKLGKILVYSEEEMKAGNDAHLSPRGSQVVQKMYS